MQELYFATHEHGPVADVSGNYLLPCDGMCLCMMAFRCVGIPDLLALECCTLLQLGHAPSMEHSIVGWILHIPDNIFAAASPCTCSSDGNTAQLDALLAILPHHS